MPDSGRKSQNVRPNTPANGAGVDRQVRKTREAIVAAFNELILERRYQAIRVADIIGLADIGRSTFYEHFRDKDDVLRRSLGGILTPMADATGDACDTTRLGDALAHFCDQRRLALGLLSGPSSREVTAVLVGLIEERLTARIRASGVTTAIPTALVAAQAAGAMLGLVRVWLDGKHTCPSGDLATAMHRLAMASTSALLEG